MRNLKLTVRAFSPVVESDTVSLTDGLLQVAPARIGGTVCAANWPKPLFAAVQLAEGTRGSGNRGRGLDYFVIVVFVVVAVAGCCQ